MDKKQSFVRFFDTNSEMKQRNKMKKNVFVVECVRPKDLPRMHYRQCRLERTHLSDKENFFRRMFPASHMTLLLPVGTRDRNCEWSRRKRHNSLLGRKHLSSDTCFRCNICDCTSEVVVAIGVAVVVVMTKRL